MENKGQFENSESMKIHNGQSYKYSFIMGILTFCILCGITLFVYSFQFVNVEITPKWLLLMSSIGVLGIAWSLLNCNISFPEKPIVIILTCCFLLIFIRKWVTYDFDVTLLMYLAGLLFLFLLIHQVATTCKPQYLFGTVIVFTLALSIHGILQYSGLMLSVKNKNEVIGNFDNPAGFAAALACVFPLCFLFFKHENDCLRYTAFTSAALMALSVFFSGSRVGMMAIAVVMTIWLLVQSNSNNTVPILNINKRLKTLFTVVFLCVLLFFLYFIKKDSADGRLLIWKCSSKMVADKPVFGHGHGAFQAKYMLYQAEYLNTHSNSRFALLADNVSHPFNEYLLVLTEHGFAGLGLLLLFGLLVFRVYRYKPNEKKLSAMMSLLALAVFSLFSYPLRYPFTWVLLFLNLTVIFNTSRFNNSFLNTFTRKRFVFSEIYSRSIIFLISIVLLVYSVILTRAEMEWNRIACFSTVKELTKYDYLYQWLGKNGFFLYNHAAELHAAKEHEKSLEVFKLCLRYYNDMDVQLLLASNYKSLGNHIDTEKHLKIAASMCPARFLPLYQLTKHFIDLERMDEAYSIAQKIIDKEIKVPSAAIYAIKNEMQKLLDCRESNNQLFKENLDKSSSSGYRSPKGRLPP